MPYRRAAAGRYRRRGQKQAFQLGSLRESRIVRDSRRDGDVFRARFVTRAATGVASVCEGSQSTETGVAAALRSVLRSSRTTVGTVHLLFRSRRRVSITRASAHLCVRCSRSWEPIVYDFADVFRPSSDARLVSWTSAAATAPTSETHCPSMGRSKPYRADQAAYPARRQGSRRGGHSSVASAGGGGGGGSGDFTRGCSYRSWPTSSGVRHSSTCRPFRRACVS